MNEKCGVPIRTDAQGTWQRCTREAGHGPDANGIDGHGLVDGRGSVYADAIDAPLYFGDGGRDPERRDQADRGDGIALTVTGPTPAPVAEIEPLREYRKRTTIWATRIPERFTVDTLEGIHAGKAGDYLAVGAAGELYPIDAEIMATTYEPAGDQPTAATHRGRFYLVRDEDVSGVSGTGRVAEGFVFEDGTAALRWLTEHRSTAIYASAADLEAIHGHNGSTRIETEAGR